MASVPVHRLPWRGSPRYPLAPSVLSHLQPADVVHVHAIDFFFDFLALTRPLHRQTMIASTHGGFFHSAQLPLVKKFWFNTVTRASIHAYHRIVACSHSDADLFRSRAGHRLAVIENGIDQAKFKGAASPVQTRTIIYFGRFAQHKRVGQLFPLLARLREQDSAWQLIVAGRDADQTAQQLMAMADEACVADAVRFVINPSDAQLRSLLGEASYSACLSAYEGFGLAAVEAMSAGLLPILSGITPFRGSSMPPKSASSSILPIPLMLPRSFRRPCWMRRPPTRDAGPRQWTPCAGTIGKRLPPNMRTYTTRPPGTLVGYRPTLVWVLTHEQEDLFANFTYHIFGALRCSGSYH